jgi:hypothetical protein
VENRSLTNHAGWRIRLDCRRYIEPLARFDMEQPVRLGIADLLEVIQQKEGYIILFGSAIWYRLPINLNSRNSSVELSWRRKGGSLSLVGSEIRLNPLTDPGAD